MGSDADFYSLADNTKKGNDGQLEEMKIVGEELNEDEEDASETAED